MKKPFMIVLHNLVWYTHVNQNYGEDTVPVMIQIGDRYRVRRSPQSMKSRERSRMLMAQNDPAWAPYRDLVSMLPLRSRVSFDKFVYKPLLAKGIPTDRAWEITRQVASEVLGKDIEKQDDRQAKSSHSDQVELDRLTEEVAKAEAALAASPEDQKLAKSLAKMKAALKRHEKHLAKVESKEIFPTKEVVILGAKELQVFASLAEKAALSDVEDPKAAVAQVIKAEGFKKVQFGYTFEDLLNGRMNYRGVRTVGPMIAVNDQRVVSDPFSAMDQLGEEYGITGSAHLNEHYRSSDLMYQFRAIHLHDLATQVRSDVLPDEKFVDVVLRSAVMQEVMNMGLPVPGANEKSTMASKHASWVMVEVLYNDQSILDSQVVSFDNAFRTAVSFEPDVLTNAYEALSTYYEEYTTAFEPGSRKRAMMVMEDPDKKMTISCQRLKSIDQLASWAGSLAVGEESLVKAEVSKTNGHVTLES